jgi:hypothetical protein
MIRKILTTFSLFLSFGAIAQDVNEDAIILNQELQFLEESARNVGLPVATRDKVTTSKLAIETEDSLESRYFGKSEDTISSKTSGPKRRRD